MSILQLLFQAMNIKLHTIILNLKKEGVEKLDGRENEQNKFIIYTQRVNITRKTRVRCTLV